MKRRYHKLTSADFERIISLYKAGNSLKVLGNMFDIDRMNIARRLTKYGITLRSRSESNKGRIPWNLGKPQLNIRGEKHWNWRGGVTSERERIMKSLDYKLWRKTVFERDNYTCQWCGDKTGGNLEADHIKRWSDYPELRLSVDNGRTLCKPCHRLTPNYLDSQGKNRYTILKGIAR